MRVWGVGLYYFLSHDLTSDGHLDLSLPFFLLLENHKLSLACHLISSPNGHLF